MKCELLILRRVQKELASLESAPYENVKQAIIELSHEPYPKRCRKLSGRDGWRIRAGDYRIIYEVDDARKAITILHIGHRLDVYR